MDRLFQLLGLAGWSGVDLLMIIGVSLGAALVSWYCCEAPCLRLKRFFPYV